MNVADYKAQHPGDRFEADIMATDISPTVLKEAREGFYCGMSASRGVDQSKIGKYFEADAGCIQVKPDIKRRVNYREHNLTQSYITLGKFDLINRRTEQIYFSAKNNNYNVQRHTHTQKT